MRRLYTIKIDDVEHPIGYPASILLSRLEDELETLRAENARLIAEREAMMKQEPCIYPIFC